MKDWKLSLDNRLLEGPDGTSLRLSSLPLFSLMLYLAYRRVTSAGEGGWVTIEEISRLRGWERHRPDSIGKDIHRYIRGRDRYPIAYGRTTRGPYRFDAAPGEINFDVELAEVERFLGLTPALEPDDSDCAAPRRPQVIHFVMALARFEGARHMGWSRPEYLGGLRDLEQLCYGDILPPSLRFLGLDRILNIQLYSRNVTELDRALSRAESVASEECQTTCKTDPITAK